MRFMCDQRGSALVEGAILIPVLFALMFGVYEFSWFFFQQHLVATGLRDAARYVARTSAVCDETSATGGAQHANARNLATTGSIAGGVPRVKGWTPAMVAIRCSRVVNSAGAAGLKMYRGGNTIYVVTASTLFARPSLGFFGFLGLQPPTISVSHSERVIGPG